MKSISLLCVLWLIWMVPSVAQNVINADKSYVSDLRNKTVSVTVIAIPDGKPSAADLSSENYHRAVVADDASQERGMIPPVVEITVSARQQDSSSESNIKKEAVITPKQIQTVTEKVIPTFIEIHAPAEKQ